MPGIIASRCAECGHLSVPAARYCPNCASDMVQGQELPAAGQLLSFTTLYSPPSGFTAPLRIGIVQAEGGARLMCDGLGEEQLSVGQMVYLEEADGIYYFFTEPGPTERQRLLARLREPRIGRARALAQSFLQRFMRRG
ncbi:MAG: OB-fold domain-containing protein [Deinococcus sp.]|nr:OB-fold domain-containing protein [Deinococcus sp.]